MCKNNKFYKFLSELIFLYFVIGSMASYAGQYGTDYLTGFLGNHESYLSNRGWSDLYNLDNSKSDLPRKDYGWLTLSLPLKVKVQSAGGNGTESGSTYIGSERNSTGDDDSSANAGGSSGDGDAGGSGGGDGDAGGSGGDDNKHGACNDSNDVEEINVQAEAERILGILIQGTRLGARDLRLLDDLILNEKVTADVRARLLINILDRNLDITKSRVGEAARKLIVNMKFCADGQQADLLANILCRLMGTTRGRYPNPDGQGFLVRLFNQEEILKRIQWLAVNNGIHANTRAYLLANMLYMGLDIGQEGLRTAQALATANDQEVPANMRARLINNMLMRNLEIRADVIRVAQGLAITNNPEIPADTRARLLNGLFARNLNREPDVLEAALALARNQEVPAERRANLLIYMLGIDLITIRHADVVEAAQELLATNPQIPARRQENLLIRMIPFLKNGNINPKVLEAAWRLVLNNPKIPAKVRAGLLTNVLVDNLEIGSTAELTAAAQELATNIRIPADIRAELIHYVFVRNLEIRADVLDVAQELAANDREIPANIRAELIHYMFVRNLEIRAGILEVAQGLATNSGVPADLRANLLVNMLRINPDIIKAVFKEVQDLITNKKLCTDLRVKLLSNIIKRGLLKTVPLDQLFAFLDLTRNPEVPAEMQACLLAEMIFNKLKIGEDGIAYALRLAVDAGSEISVKGRAGLLAVMALRNLLKGSTELTYAQGLAMNQEVPMELRVSLMLHFINLVNSNIPGVKMETLKAVRQLAIGNEIPPTMKDMKDLLCAKISEVFRNLERTKNKYFKKCP